MTRGQTIEVERLGLSEGAKIELDQVLLIAYDDGVNIGKPTVEGAKVLATVVNEEKGKKVIVFKYKPKVRYRRKIGHRQIHTRLLIDDIVVPAGGGAREE